MKQLSNSNRSHAYHAALLAGILLTLALNVLNNDFLYGFHFDEKKKVRFVQTGSEDFHHPILMLQAGRIIDHVIQTENEQELVPYLRSVSALSGLLLVVVCFFMSRRMLHSRFELIAGVAVCVSPILVMHAHYFKEDMIFAAFAYLSLFFYLEFLNHRSKKLLLALGVATGLALSSQYKAVLLIPLYLLFPLADPRVDRTGLFRDLLLMLVGALVVFLVVNYPAVLDPQNFMQGVKLQKRHIMTGHSIRVYPLPNLFSFHIVNSLVPGLTLPVLLASGAGLISTLISWKKCSTGLRLLVFFVLIFYLAHEITPMKTWPDFMRYMVPCAPALILFAVKGIQDLGCLLRGRLPATVASGTVVVLLTTIIVYPLYNSALLLYNIGDRDTRIRAEAWLADQGVEFVAELYALPEHRDVISLTVVDINEMQQRGVDYLVASSFQFGRYDFGAKLPRQRKGVYRVKRQYDAIFEFPYHEIMPYYKSYAFSNPLIRIVDIRKRPCIQRQTNPDEGFNSHSCLQ